MMLWKHRWLLCVLLCCLVSCSDPDLSFLDDDSSDSDPKSTYTGEKVLMTIKFTPGSYALSESMDMKLKMDVKAQGQKVEMKMGFPLTLAGDVDISKPDQTREQEIRFTCRAVKMGMKMNVNAGGRTMDKSMSYDTAGRPEDQDPELESVCRPFVGWVATIRGRDGKFTDVKGAEFLMGKIRRSASPEMRGMMGNLEKQMQAFTEEMLTKHWGALIPTYPVGPGDRWSKPITIKTMPMLGPTTLDCSCEVKDIEETSDGKIVVLDFSIRTTIKNKPLDMSAISGIGRGGSATIKSLTLTQNGTARFDTSIGLSTRATVRATGKGDISIRAGGETATADMDLQMDYKNTLTKKSSAPRPDK